MDNREKEEKYEINQIEKDSNDVYLFGKNLEKNKNEKKDILNIDLNKLENKLNLIKYQSRKQNENFINKLGEYDLILSEKEYEIRRIKQENELLQITKKNIINEINYKKRLNILFNTKSLLLDSLIKAFQNKIKLNENLT